MVRRLGAGHPRALVQTSVPVNKFPAFVAYLVRRLKVLCPTLGKARIANVLCRAGLHLSATTVGRMIRGTTDWEVVDRPTPAQRCIRSQEPDLIWNVDLRTVPTHMGFWCSWMPRSVTQRWPFCWWVAVAVDLFSRRAIRQARSRPRVLITDHGSQFIDEGFGRWCRRRGIRRRFGAVQKFGSLSVVEWYNSRRPHRTLEVRTPDEVYFQRQPACHRPRFEPRRHWPRGSPCAGPQAPVRGRRGRRLGLHVTYMGGRDHLPIVELKKTA